MEKVIRDLANFSSVCVSTNAEESLGNGVDEGNNSVVSETISADLLGIY